MGATVIYFPLNQSVGIRICSFLCETHLCSGEVPFFLVGQTEYTESDSTQACSDTQVLLLALQCKIWSLFFVQALRSMDGGSHSERVGYCSYPLVIGWYLSQSYEKFPISRSFVMICLLNMVIFHTYNQRVNYTPYWLNGFRNGFRGISPTQQQSWRPEAWKNNWIYPVNDGCETGVFFHTILIYIYTIIYICIYINMYYIRVYIYICIIYTYIHIYIYIMISHNVI